MLRMMDVLTSFFALMRNFIKNSNKKKMVENNFVPSYIRCGAE